MGLLPMTYLPDYDAAVLTLLSLDIAHSPRMFDHVSMYAVIVALVPLPCISFGVRVLH